MVDNYFTEQQQHTEQYLLPYFDKHIPDFRNKTVLEIGCAEAGLLNVLHGLGMHVRGVELLKERAAIANEVNPDLVVHVADATDPRLPEIVGETFDIIIMRETLEHIPDRIPLFNNIDRLLKPGGFYYVTFPPYFSPFAGHQQGGTTFLRRVPWLHFLPGFVLRPLGKLFKEKDWLIDFVLVNRRDGISIAKFEQLCRRYRLEPVVKELFFTRPVYQVRFNMKTRRFPNIPIIREFLALGCECLLRKNDKM